MKRIWRIWGTEGIQLRRNEKKLLNDVNNDKDGRLRFHILGEKGKKKKRIQTREEKIFILANDCLTGDPLIHDLSLSQVHFLERKWFLNHIMLERSHYNRYSCTGHEFYLLKWMQNCQMHERIFCIQKELQRNIQLNASCKIFVSETLGWQSLFTQTTTWHWNGDCQGFYLTSYCF